MSQKASSRLPSPHAGGFNNRTSFQHRTGSTRGAQALLPTTSSSKKSQRSHHLVKVNVSRYGLELVTRFPAPRTRGAQERASPAFLMLSSL